MLPSTQVTIVQRILPRYRVPFIVALHEALAKRGIELKFIYGQERSGTVPVSVAFDAPWARRITNRYFPIAGKEPVWQPCLTLIDNSALVIVEQSNRLLVNLALLGLSRYINTKIAFWGHGKNFQAHEKEPLEFLSGYLKNFLSVRVHWWFAYTSLSQQAVIANGYPGARVTVVQNAIDTSNLDAHLNLCNADEVHRLERAFNVTPGFVGLYCGGMYRHKRLGFLLEACRLIKDRVPQFSMIFIGDGPDSSEVVRAAAECPWIHYAGPKYERELAPFYRISSAILMPGAVGLAIVDSFVAGIPLFTTNISLHGPEIAYLENRVNGVITADHPREYADAVTDFLMRGEARVEFAEGLKHAKAKYTLDNMVANFADGIEAALAHPVKS